MSTALFDLMRLSAKTGKIPAMIPAHYVLFAQQSHSIILSGKIKTLKAAQAIAGSLGKPSKMPGYAYGISAELCKTGQKLAKVTGSVCSDCYACKANYKYPSVVTAHAKRLANIGSNEWIESMILLISRTGNNYFRWHDSGDLQSSGHLKAIVQIAHALPNVNFWLPTKEKGILATAKRAGLVIPDNLTIRLSAAMVDSDKVNKELTGNVSLVQDKVQLQGYHCKAPKQNGKCEDCRACWDKSIDTVVYFKH